MMGRLKRHHSVGSFYHVMVRGNGGTDIFFPMTFDMGCAIYCSDCIPDLDHYNLWAYQKF